MSRTHETITSLKAIPRERLTTKLWRTFWAFMVVAAFVLAVVLFAAPYYVGLVGVCFGGVIASGEIVFAPFRLFFAFLIDLFAKFQRAKKGESDAAAGGGESDA